jgi:5-methylcytosine-specific restriction endonuclease McrA
MRGILSSFSTAAPTASPANAPNSPPAASSRSAARPLTGKSLHPTPPLSNRELFHRDRHICAYCAREFSSQKLTRDHVLPVSQGGRDTWMNVVTACRHCNQTKSGRTPEQARMELVYAPYVPNKAEYLILCNRNILADQMDFLARHVPSQSRVRAA